VNTARLVLRDLVNATVGFDALAAETEKPAKSLHRMSFASASASSCKRVPSRPPD
jgi:hypothetical protein